MDIPSDGYTKGFEHVQNNMYQNTKNKKEDGQMHSNQVSSRSIEEWTFMGPDNIAGRTLSLAINPQADSTLFAGSASGGLWRSRSLGLNNSWKRLETGFPVMGVSCIEFAPLDSTVLLIGTGEVYNPSGVTPTGSFRVLRGSYRMGILKSRDGGSTWEKSLDWSHNQQEGIWAIKFAEDNPNIVFANTTKGLYRSLDQGENWDHILDVQMGMDIEIDRYDSNQIVASFGNFSSQGKGIYYSEDGGDTWSQCSEIPDFYGKILLTRSRSNTNVLYASAGNLTGDVNDHTWLLKSEDSGHNWSIVNDTDYASYQGWYSHDVSVSPQNSEEVLAAGLYIHKSEDGGETLVQKSGWGKNLSVAFGDNHVLLHHLNIEDLVLVGNDGGVFISVDGGENYIDANEGYHTTQFYNGFPISQIDPNIAAGGLQDHNCVLYSGENSWEKVFGGDGSWTALSNFDKDVIFTSYNYLRIKRSEDGGQTFEDCPSPLTDIDWPLFIAPFVASPSTEGILYAGARKIYKSDDNGRSWRPTNEGEEINGQAALSMSIAPTNADILYVGFAPNGFLTSPENSIYITKDGGATWVNIGEGLPNLIPNDIHISENDPASAIAVFNGFGDSHVFKTNDFGATWIDIHGNLPDVPTNAVTTNPYNENHIFIGNVLGVFISYDEGETYETDHLGLPSAVIVTDLKISKTDETLWVATHGNGAFRRPLEVGNPVAVNDIGDIVLNVFPNPTTTKIQVEISKGQVDKLRLFDINGRLILSSTGKSIIEVGHLASGNYLLKVTSGKSEFVEQVSVQ